MFVLEQGKLIEYCLRAGLLGVLFALGYLLLGFQRILFACFPKALNLILQAVADLFFWGVIAFSDMLMVYSANRGRIRILALLVQLFCFLICYLPLKKPIRRVETAVIGWISRVFIYPIVSFIKKGITEQRIRWYNRRIDKRMQKDGEMLINEIKEILDDKKERI